MASEHLLSAALSLRRGGGSRVGPERIALLEAIGGLRSIRAHIGNDFRRVRIGVGHPGDKDLVQFYVLSPFAKGERAWVEALCDAIAENAALLARGDDASFQNKVHLALAAKGLFEPKRSAPAD